MSGDGAVQFVLAGLRGDQAQGAGGSGQQRDVYVLVISSVGGWQVTLEAVRLLAVDAADGEVVLHGASVGDEQLDEAPGWEFDGDGVEGELGQADLELGLGVAVEERLIAAGRRGWLATPAGGQQQCGDAESEREMGDAAQGTDTLASAERRRFTASARCTKTASRMVAPSTGVATRMIGVWSVISPSRKPAMPALKPQNTT